MLITLTLNHADFGISEDRFNEFIDVLRMVMNKEFSNGEVVINQSSEPVNLNEVVKVERVSDVAHADLLRQYIHELLADLEV